MSKKGKKYPKVYLAKSNRANPDDVQIVRELLKTYEVEVVEYKGGAYNKDLLLKCDSLIVVPDLNELIHKEECHDVMVGKGLYHQVWDFFGENGSNFKNVKVVVNTSPWMVTALNIEAVDVEDHDDYVNYGWLYLETPHHRECDNYGGGIYYGEEETVNGFLEDNYTMKDEDTYFNEMGREYDEQYLLLLKN